MPEIADARLAARLRVLARPHRRRTVRRPLLPHRHPFNTIP
jgi:hypothetical protein